MFSQDMRIGVYIFKHIQASLNLYISNARQREVFLDLA
jgi:hypothetical protein